MPKQEGAKQNNVKFIVSELQGKNSLSWSLGQTKRMALTAERWSTCLSWLWQVLTLVLGPDSFNLGRQPAPLGITGMWWRFGGLFLLQSYDKRLSEKGDGVLGFPCGSAACNVGDVGLILGLGRCPGEGKGYPLQHSGLENSMNCIVHGVAKNQTRLSNFHFHRYGKKQEGGKILNRSSLVR